MATAILTLLATPVLASALVMLLLDRTMGTSFFLPAGLIVDGDANLLVDTLFDVPLTREMLDTMRDAVPASKIIKTVVNTHANGDHTFGNQLLIWRLHRLAVAFCSALLHGSK